MNYRILALYCVLATPLLALAQPLPQGAIARFGIPRFDVPGGYGVALSPDGKEVAFAGTARLNLKVEGVVAPDLANPSIHVWDVEQARFLRRTEWYIDNRNWPTMVIWSAKGQRIAAMNDGDAELRVWHATTGRSLWPGKPPKLETKQAFIHGFRFINGDRQLAVAYMDRKSTTWHVEVWDVEAGKRNAIHTFDKDKRATLGMPAGYDIRHVALSPSGEHVAWLAAPAAKDAKEGGSLVWVFETATDKLLHTLKDLPRSHRIGLPDEGKTLVLCPIRPENVDGNTSAHATVVNVPDGRVRFQCAYRFRPAKLGMDGGGARGRTTAIVDQTAAARFANALLTIDEVGMTRWDFDSGKKLDSYEGPMTSFAVSADEKRIAVRDGERLAIGIGAFPSLSDPPVFSGGPHVRFLPDGTLMGNDSADFQDGMRYVWDPRKQTLLGASRLYAYPADALWNVTGYGSQDAWGKRIVLYQNVQGVRCFTTFDLVSNRPMARIKGEGRAHLSSDSKRVLFTDNLDSATVRWFDADDGKELGRHKLAGARAPLEYAKSQAKWYSANGAVFGYETADHQLVLVDCATGKATRAVPAMLPGRDLKKPTSLFQSAGGFRLIWARSYESSPSAVPEHLLWDNQGHLLRCFSLPPEYKTWWLDEMRLTPDGRSLLIPKGGINGPMEFYETATGRRRGELPARAWGSAPRYLIPNPDLLDISPDATLLATTNFSTILLWDLARPLNGKAALPTPRSGKEADALWDILSNPDPAESDRALWALVAAPEPTLMMMKERLKAAVWPESEAKRLQQLIRQLDSANFKERTIAGQELLSLKETALPILRAARKGASLEQVRRLDEVIEQLQKRLISAEAIPGYLREIRALEVLERIGTPEARKLVEAMAHGADAVPTYEAQLILARWQETARRRTAGEKAP